MKLRNNSGFVSIIVAALLMVIMSLITLGFTKIMQREQRQALDRQLSTQAFYAAESGINDFYRALDENYQDPIAYPLQESKNTCDTSVYPARNNGIIGEPTGVVAYTCLQYDQSVPSLKFDNGSIKTNKSKIVPIRSKSGSNITSITVTWEHSEGLYGLSSPCDANDQSFPATRSGQVPIMRVDLVKLPKTGSGASFNRDGLINNSINLYLYPKNGCGETQISTADHDDANEKGKIVSVLCDENAASKACSLKILISTSDTDDYVMRLRSVYADANVELFAEEATGNQFEFLNAQTLVDVTGKANDVLRRIQVRIPAGSGRVADSVPEAVFGAMNGFCKVQLVTAVGSPGVPNGDVDLNQTACP